MLLQQSWAILSGTDLIVSGLLLSTWAAFLIVFIKDYKLGSPSVLWVGWLTCFALLFFISWRWNEHIYDILTRASGGLEVPSVRHPLYDAPQNSYRPPQRPGLRGDLVRPVFTSGRGFDFSHTAPYYLQLNHWSYSDGGNLLHEYTYRYFSESIKQGIDPVTITFPQFFTHSTATFSVKPLLINDYNALEACWNGIRSEYLAQQTNR